MLQLPKFTAEDIQEFKDFTGRLYNALPDDEGEHEAANLALFKETWGEDMDIPMSAFFVWYFKDKL